MALEPMDHDQRRHRRRVPPGIATDRRIALVQRERLRPLRELETARARHPFPLPRYVRRSERTDRGRRGPSSWTSPDCHAPHTRGPSPLAHGPSGTSQTVHSLGGKAGIMFGMDGEERRVSVGDDSATPADQPEWSSPSRWYVPESERRVLAPPPPPPPAPQGPNRLTAALVVALVVAMATATWAIVDRWDIDFSRPEASEAPAPRPSHDPARPGGRFSPRPPGRASTAGTSTAPGRRPARLPPPGPVTTRPGRAGGSAPGPSAPRLRRAARPTSTSTRWRPRSSRAWSTSTPSSAPGSRGRGRVSSSRPTARS